MTKKNLTLEKLTISHDKIYNSEGKEVRANPIGQPRIILCIGTRYDVQRELTRRIENKKLKYANFSAVGRPDLFGYTVYNKKANSIYLFPIQYYRKR